MKIVSSLNFTFKATEKSSHTKIQYSCPCLSKHAGKSVIFAICLWVILHCYLLFSYRASLVSFMSRTCGTCCPQWPPLKILLLKLHSDQMLGFFQFLCAAESVSVLTAADATLSQLSGDADCSFFVLLKAFLSALILTKMSISA